MASLLVICSSCVKDGKSMWRVYDLLSMLTVGLNDFECLGVEGHQISEGRLDCNGI